MVCIQAIQHVPIFLPGPWEIVLAVCAEEELVQGGVVVAHAAVGQLVASQAIAPRWADVVRVVDVEDLVDVVEWVEHVAELAVGAGVAEADVAVDANSLKIEIKFR